MAKYKQFRPLRLYSCVIFTGLTYIKLHLNHLIVFSLCNIKSYSMLLHFVKNVSDIVSVQTSLKKNCRNGFLNLVSAVQSSNSVKSSEKPLAKKGFCGTLGTQAICQYVRDSALVTWMDIKYHRRTIFCLLVIQLPVVSMFQTMLSTIYHFTILLISRRKHCKLMRCLREAYIILTVFWSVLTVNQIHILFPFHPDNDSHLNIGLSF